MNISDETVEAAAMAILCVGEEVWELQTPRVKDAARSDARAALEAAVPFMLRVAWNEGWEAGTLSQFTEPRNPYNSPV